MDTINAILTRRSIRKYKKTPIPDEYIQKWITCGMYAPSAGNEQPWHFIVIDDPELLKKIPEIHAHASMISDASLGILICIDPSLEKHESMAVQDCAAATQNVLLAVHESSYGAVWLGVYPRQERMEGLRELLKIPKDIIPFALLSIGAPDEQKQDPQRFIQKRVHKNQW